MGTPGVASCRCHYSDHYFRALLKVEIDPKAFAKKTLVRTMGKNFKETRERLRKLLHKKKTKRRPPPNPLGDCKSEKSGQAPTTTVPSASKGPNSRSPKEKLVDTPKLKQSPSLDDLLEFIEGNDAVCKNEKKAAKKARQFEKKQMLLLQKQREEEERIRQAEEERLRKEREIEMLENLRRANNAKKKRNKKRKQQLLQQQQQQQPQHNTQSTRQQKQQPQQHKKPEFSPPHIPGTSNHGAQMVTIKRVMEPHDSEPTVTITLRGATPKQDKVLYTLFNGKVCETSKNAKVPNSKNPKDVKFLKETENPAAPLKKVIPPKPQPTPVLPLHTMDKKIVKDNLNYQIPTVPPTPRSTKELTNPTSIQISNAVTSMTRNGFHDFNFEGIKLPPGITITKVDPFNTKIKMTSRPDEDSRNQVSLKPIPKPPKKAPTPEVIIVSTNKLKEESDAKLLSARQEAGKSISNSSKRRRRKKEAAAAAAAEQSAAKLPSSYPGLDIEVIKSGDEATSDLCDQLSVLTINPYAKEGDPEQPTKSKKKRKKRKKAKAEGGADSEDWNTLDNDVFAPKDLDLDDGDIDDAERELEAFKLFCMQSVPLKRKEKVNLNLKDLVLKKKSVSCS